MGRFALVHGAWHGAWCWERLIAELEVRGHDAIAIELPADDPAATFETYADVVVERLDGEGGEVVLVGHSLAGHTIPLAAARRPFARLVYLCALVPDPGKSFAEQVGAEPDMLDPSYTNGLGEMDAEGRRGWVDLELARHHMYADCDDAAASAALARTRVQATTPYRRPFPLSAFPDTPATYIVCADDRLVMPDWSRRVARERLGAETVELPGSHSPFWSRPRELAEVLDGLV